jgi:transcription antitermination factor NusG
MAERWYALVVRRQHERAIAQYLRTRRLDTLVPVYRARRRWSDRCKEVELPLFPNYVLSRFSWRQRTSLFRVPGIRSVVSFGDSPAAISEEEIAALRLMVDSGVVLKPRPYLKPGQKVRIERGPLKGLEGALVRENNDWHIVGAWSYCSGRWRQWWIGMRFVPHRGDRRGGRIPDGRRVRQ